MIRELMNKESLTGRPQSPLLSVLNGTGNIPIKEEKMQTLTILFPLLPK